MYLCIDIINIYLVVPGEFINYHFLYSRTTLLEFHTDPLEFL